MTVLNFPDDPASVNNTYIAPNGVTYYYDGVKWVGQNSSNRQIDRITAGDKNLIINTDGRLTLPNGSTIGDGDADFGVPITTARGTILIGNQSDCYNVNHFHIMRAGQQDIELFLGDDNNYVKLPSTGGVEISSSEIGTQYYWTFGTDGNLTLPENGTIRSQPSSNISINSDQYADIEWYNPAIFDLDTSNFNNLNAGDTIGNLVGVDQDGAYFSVIVADTDGATSATFNTWGVNTDGNLFTERFTTGDGGTTELPPGDIIDFEGNSLVYVPTTNTAPSHDHNGLLWFNTEDGRAYIRYNHQWVDANPPVVAPVSAYLDGLVIEGQTISSIDYVESAVKIGGDLVPDEDLTYNLGSPTKQWKHLYVDSNTIYMGGKALSLTNQGLEVDGRTAIYEIDGGVASTWLTV